MMISKADLKQFVSRIWGNKVFLILLLFNLLSNGVAVMPYPDAISVFMIVCISALSAAIESCICRLFGNEKARNCVLGLFVALHLIAAIVDIFLIANFRMIFTMDVIGILAETTPIEIRSFLSTYLNATSILTIVVLVFLIIWAIVKIAKKMVGNRPVAFTAMALSLIGALIYAHTAFMHLTTGEGGRSVSQLHSFTRLGSAFAWFRGTYANILEMRDVNRGVEASLRQDDVPSMIVVIGESFSVYHSSLYGYSKPTNPLLSTRMEEGSLIVFDNVVSASDHTGNVLQTVFRIIGSDEPASGNVLFPACFRKAGYKTALVDNQYFVGRGLSWLTDEDLSEIMFDFRNKEDVHYDMDLFPMIPEFPEPELILIHLFGQHFTYADRYTPPFKRYTEADYSKNLSASEREIVAHYDNSTLYNDFAVDSIIKMYEDKNCMIVYFSDHGEEIYEIDDFMGHGNARQRPTLDYQIRVPFMIWTSSKFQEQYPDIVMRIQESKHKPMITQDLPHFLFDVGGVETKYFRPELSFISEDYDESKPRIVLDTIDYDKARNKQPFKPRY